MITTKCWRLIDSWMAWYYWFWVMQSSRKVREFWRSSILKCLYYCEKRHKQEKEKSPTSKCFQEVDGSGVNFSWEQKLSWYYNFCVEKMKLYFLTSCEMKLHVMKNKIHLKFGLWWLGCKQLLLRQWVKLCTLHTSTIRSCPQRNSEAEHSVFAASAKTKHYNSWFNCGIVQSIYSL